MAVWFVCIHLLPDTAASHYSQCISNADGLFFYFIGILAHSRTLQNDINNAERAGFLSRLTETIRNAATLKSGASPRALMPHRLRIIGRIQFQPFFLEGEKKKISGADFENKPVNSNRLGSLMPCREGKLPQWRGRSCPLEMRQWNRMANSTVCVSRMQEGDGSQKCHGEGEGKEESRGRQDKRAKVTELQDGERLCPADDKKPPPRVIVFGRDRL